MEMLRLAKMENEWEGLCMEALERSTKSPVRMAGARP